MKGKKTREITRTSSMSNHWGGCFECKGGDRMWDAPNVQAIAAQHARAYGHHTWADITFGHRYSPAEE